MIASVFGFQSPYGKQIIHLQNALYLVVTYFLFNLFIGLSLDHYLVFVRRHESLPAIATLFEETGASFYKKYCQCLP